MSNLRAFHGNTAIKERYLQRVRMHRAADQLIKGTYWQNGKGCAVGCTIHSGEHSAYETELGIPRALARLEDRFFEGMSNGAATSWPERFLAAIPVGADLSQVIDHFMIWMLGDAEWGVMRFAREQDRHLIQDVITLYQRQLAGETISDDEWLKAARAARSAAAAYATAYAARSAHYERMADKLIELLSAAPVPSVA